MNIYLDIDGVLLANEKFPANHAHEFLEYLVNNFDVYWLTTHCRGDASQTIEHLRPTLKPSTLEIAKRVKPTNWDDNKTEGIDFSIPFLWFDDELYPEERESLIAHGALDSHVLVDLASDPDRLFRLLSMI